MPTFVPQPIHSFLLPAAAAPVGKPVAILARAIDPSTGEYLSIARGFDPTDAAVFAALRTVRASGSAVENFGQRFADHPRVDTELDSFLREEVRIALKHLTDRGDVKIAQVVVLGEGDTANLYVEFENVARQRKRSSALPLGQLIGSAA